MKDYPNTPCHHPQRPSLDVGQINYTAEQINALLALIPLKVGREDLNQLISFTSDNFIGHYPDASMLTDQKSFAWAFVGDLAAAVPYFHYMEGYAPKGYAPGWNNMQHIFGTYPLFTDNREDQLTAEELFKVPFRLPELTAHRALADEHGNRIPDTYVTRQGLTEHIRATYNKQFLENPPLITEGYITPGMLSEETRQMLEATGQEIHNLPDGEDLNTVHGVLKLANKEYNPNSYSGMGRIYLRKNIVAGRNVLTQSMISKPNTIYIIQYDYDLQDTEITIPEGCVLDFQGGSLSNGIVHGNFDIKGSGLKCNTTNRSRVFDAKCFGISKNQSADFNSKMLQMLIDNKISICFSEVGDIEFNETIYLIGGNSLDICGLGYKKTNLVFPNGDGFVWKSTSEGKGGYSSHNRIANICISSKGVCLNFSNGKDKLNRLTSVYKSCFEHLKLESKESDAIYADDNYGQGDQLCWSNRFYNIAVNTPNGNGFYGVWGLDNIFDTIRDEYYIGDSLFKNCYGVFRNINFGHLTPPHFLTWDANMPNRYGCLISMENCNIEGLKGAAIDTITDNKNPANNSTFVRFVNCSFQYIKDRVQDGKLNFFPISLIGLTTLHVENCTFYKGDMSFEEGFDWFNSSSETGVAKNLRCVSDQPLVIHNTYNKFSDILVNPNIFNENGFKLNSGIDVLAIKAKSLFLNDSDIIDVDIVDNNYDKYLPIKTDLTNITSSKPVNIVSLKLDNSMPKYEKNYVIKNVGSHNITFIGEHAVEWYLALVTENSESFILQPGKSMVVTYKDGRFYHKQMERLGGRTALRPTLRTENKGYYYYDTTLNKPIWWTGEKWVDATGTEV